MPTSLTTVPDVLLALVALGQTTLTGVIVFDGPPDVDNLPGEFLCIGWSRDEDEASVDGTSADDGNYSSSESYSVHCLLSVATGDTDSAAIAARRTRLSALFTAFGVGLRTDPALGGVLVAGARATISTVSWIYGPSTEGSYAEVDFDIDVSASYLGMP